MPVEIPLTRGLVCLIDEADAERVLQYKWYAAPGPHTFYACRTIYGAAGPMTKKNVHMHRWLLNAPTGVAVDHKDWNGLNNQRSNIRLCTAGQNRANRRFVSNRAGYKGVRLSRGTTNRFQAYIKKYISLGSFGSAEEAARAYDAAAIELFGEFASLNFPELRNAA